MERTSVLALVDEVCRLDAASHDRAAWVAAASAARRLRGWLDAFDVSFARAMAATGPCADDAIARATLTSSRDAARTLERAATATAAPTMAAALAEGEVTAAHVDELTRAAKRLEPAQRAALLADADLSRAAVGLTPNGYRMILDDEVRRLQADEGMAEFDRQQAAVRLRLGERSDGMWFVSGCLDPVSGLRLRNRLANEVDRRFAERTPPHCPTDAGEKQDFLRAHALLSLTGGGGPGVARPDLIVVEDHTTGSAEPVIDLGADVTIPRPVLTGLLAGARRFHVTVHNGRIVSAPGRLDLGRTSRVANTAQRRALQAVYPTCAVPGCPVRFAATDIHHVVWWERGGATDLDNLLPLCCRHHHAVHDEGWLLALAPDRTLTVTFPDGSTMATGPPTRQRTSR
jgi:hypothetical protein